MSALSASILARAPGKLMLLGEYVVLEGAPAMVVAVDRWAEVRARPAAAFSLAPIGRPWGPVAFSVDEEGEAHFGPGAPPRAELVVAVEVLRAAVAWARQQGIAASPLALTVDTQAFHAAAGGAKLGLGSSAAVATALLAAVAGAWGLLAPDALRAMAGRQSLYARAADAHRRAQAGRGSGADVAAAVFGGLLRVARRRDDPDAAPTIAPLPTPAPVCWGAAAVGPPASTPALLARVEALKAGAPARYWEIFERLGIAAQAGAEFWALGDAAAFVSMVEAFHAALVGLGEAAAAPIVTAEHARLHALVRRHGGAYKISGAGGGDLGVAFTTSAQARRRLARHLASAGFQELSLAATDRGVTIEEAA